MRKRRTRRALGLGLAMSIGLLAGSPSTASASPREDMRQSYAMALDQFNNLDYPAAKATIDGAIDGAQSSGAGEDPVLASLYVLRAALLYSEEGDVARARILQALQRAAALNYYVIIPVEVRSEELTAFLNEARAAAGGSPPDPITHSFPDEACGADLLFEALLGVPDGGQAALYWRQEGSADYAAIQMEVFSNVASATIRASEHGDANIEYIIAAFDSANQNVANLGTQDAPLKLPQDCTVAVVGDGDAGDGDAGDGDGDDGGEDTKEKKKKPSGDSDRPKVWINLGLGTGFGIARGAVDLTYSQMRPQPLDYLYGDAQGACAVARFVTNPGDELAPTGVLYGADPANPVAGSAFSAFAPTGKAAAYGLAYNEEACAERHPVTTGIAPAPFHIEPEVAFRIGDKVILGVFGRLQIVTGSDVEAPANPNVGDPGNEAGGGRYWESARAGLAADGMTPVLPAAAKLKHGFTFAAGLKFKYLLGKEGGKLRPYVGAYAGGGQSRLRVDLGFGQDRNGNSVPDNEEVGADASDSIGTNCQPVWPYTSACEDQPGTGDNALAQAVAAKSGATGNRIDTVTIGPVFAGALVGFNLQLAKHFGLYGEAQVGGWFPTTGSLLIDLNFGPQITF